MIPVVLGLMVDFEFAMDPSCQQSTGKIGGGYIVCVRSI